MHRFFRIVLICLSASTLAGDAWSLPPPAQVTVRELIPLASWHKQFKIITGTDKGKVVPLMFRSDPANEQRWTLIFGDYAGIVLLNDPDGGLLMEQLHLFKSRSYIVYQPALPILPGDMSSGAFILRRASFKMYDRETRKLKRNGVVTHLVKRVWPSQFDTPVGLIDGYRVEIEHGMEMQYAQLLFTLGIGFRLDEGPVYGSGEYRLTKLKIFSQTKAAAAALVKR
ncbi:MAG: hypothetical protein HY695_34090 [Deltaproteobacteria bacterium]|nr:hypothetical protein [Deltaproteobacteria bacterium]